MINELKIFQSARLWCVTVAAALFVLAITACSGGAPATQTEPVAVEVTRIWEQAGPEVPLESRVEVTRETPVEVTRVVTKSLPLEDPGELIPPRVIAGEVRGERFTMGDLVERIRVLQGIDRYQGGQFDLSTIPFQLLTDLLHAEILRQAAPGLGINIIDDQIEEAIRGQFRPEPQPGQEVDDAQLDAEYQNIYTGFLTQVNLTDDVYRRIIEERLQQRELFTRMLESLPEEAPQVEVQVIPLNINSTASPDAVKERLELGEDFATVSREISGSDGYIGWVPEGALPEFDRYLFGETVVYGSGETIRKLALLGAGDISDPIYEDQYIFLIQAIGPVETREVELAMQFQLAGARLEQWKDGQLVQGSQEGWVKINFDSHHYAWVTEQARLTRPRVTPEAQQQSGGRPR